MLGGCEMHNDAMAVSAVVSARPEQVRVQQPQRPPRGDANSFFH